MGDTRDRRAIAAVACPRCNAWVGYPCFHKGRPTAVKLGKPFCHAERRQAWLEAKHAQERSVAG